MHEPQAWLGLTFNWGSLLGFTAAHGRLGWAAVLLYASGVFWTLGYDTIYALQDIEDDALAGIKSSARRLGSNVQAGIGVFYLICALLAGGLMRGAAWSSLLAAGFAGHLAWQVWRLKGADPSTALVLFKSNRNAGLLLFVALALLRLRSFAP